MENTVTYGYTSEESVYWINWDNISEEMQISSIWIGLYIVIL